VGSDVPDRWWGEAPEWPNRLRRGMDFRYHFARDTEAPAEPDPARAMHTRVLTFRPRGEFTPSRGGIVRFPKGSWLALIVVKPR
jgi:hypothetical protein